MKKKVWAVLLTLVATVCCVFGISACNREKTVAVTEVTVNEQTLALVEGESKTLTATVTPDNATDKAVSWSSSDKEVATVAPNGVVTAVKAGTATITVTTHDGGKTATCAVTVTAATVSVTGVALGEETLTLKKGTDHTLVATVAPENATDKAVTWTSSDDEVATVSESGVVTALKEGTTTVTATTHDGGKTSTCAVTVPVKGQAKVDPYEVTVSETAVKSANLEGDISYWFTFTLEEAAKVSFSSGYVAGGDNSYIVGGSFALTDAEGNEVKSGEASDTAFTAFQEELQAGTYYFTVTAECHDGAKHTVSFQKIVPAPGSLKELAINAVFDKEYKTEFNKLSEGWLLFVPEQTTIVKITETRESNATSVSGTLYKGDEEVAKLVWGYYDSSANMKQTLEAGAKYYFKVEHSTSNAVSVIFETIEAGSSKDVAKTVTFGTADEITLGAGKDCWYVFELAEPSVVTASAGDATVTFEGASKTEDNSATYLAAGTYYVKVTNGGTAEASLTVTLTRTDVPEMPEGSTREKAFEITVGVTEYVSEEYNDFDERWFKFTLDKARTVTLRSVKDDNDKYLEINYALYAGDGDTPIAETPATYEDGNFYTTQNLEAGTYYLKVVRKAGLAIYTVHAQAAPDGSSLEEAVSASIGKSYGVSANEYWFTFKSTTATNVIIYSTGDCDTVGEVQFSTGYTWGDPDDNSGEGNNFRIEKSLTANIVYYLKVTAQGTDPAFTVYFATPGTTQGAALSATLGQSYSGSVSSSSQYWLAYTPDKDIEVKVSVSGYFSSGAYVNVFDYTQDPARVGGGNGYSSFNFTLELTANKTYYFLCTSTGSTTITVKLEEIVQMGGGDKVEIPTNATQLSIPSFANTLPDGGEGWFKIVASEAWVYVWAQNDDADFIQKSAITYNLYDAEGNFLATNNSSVLGKYLDGTYYLKVTFTGTNGCSLKIAYTDPLE